MLSFISSSLSYDFADLHILLNTVHAPAIFDAATTTPVSWLPICLPKFNSDGFLHAYVQFLRPGDLVIEEAQNDEQQNQSNSNEELEGGGSANTTQASQTDATVTESHADVPDAAPPCDDQSSSAATVNTSSGPSLILSPPPTSTLDTSHLRGRIGTALICISGGGGGEFENTRSWCEGVVQVRNVQHSLLFVLRRIAQNLEESGTLSAIHTSIRRRPRNSVQRTKYGFGGDYSVSSLGITGLRHFIYKNRSLVQVTCPVWSDDYAGPAARRRYVSAVKSLYMSLTTFGKGHYSIPNDPRRYTHEVWARSKGGFEASIHQDGK